MTDRPANAPPQVPDHELLRCIGEGSYGEVWLARNILGGFRAIKIIRRDRFKEERPFEREFVGIQKFEPVSRTHPGLVAVLHVGQNLRLGYFYYVMEIADDAVAGQAIEPDRYQPKTLSSELKQRRSLPPAESARLGMALASALGHLHEHGLVHRDIKPSNIIFVNGQSKLADIGLVTAIGENATCVGTAGYIAPEGPGSPSADLFSLGKVLYEVSMGKECSSFPELPTRLGEASSLPSLIRLNQIILKACDPIHRDRYQAAGDLCRDLAALVGSDETTRGGSVRAPASPPRAPPARPTAPPANRRLVVLHRGDTQPDRSLMEYLCAQMTRRGWHISAERSSTSGMDWIRELDTTLRAAEAAIVLLSPKAAQSEMIAYEVETAWQLAQHQQGRPRFLVVCVGFQGDPPSALARALNVAQCFHWESAQDNERVLADLTRALESTRSVPTPDRPLRPEATGGAVPLDSAFYVVRPADREFQQAIARRDSIVLVKGARQMGKTSLLARGLQHARDADARVVLTDFQKLNAAHLASAEALFMTLGELLADQLDLNTLPRDTWDARRGPNTNFERYLRREILNTVPQPLVWGLDEVDRLFLCSFGSEVFGLFRSWHNERALDPAGPWSRLTLAIAYATEAHLFITDLNQSPFNVGTRLTLDDFSFEQVADLNQRHGSPLARDDELRRFHALLGGQPYLVRRALNELATGTLTFGELAEHADRAEGFFGDHLRRILALLAKDDELREVLRGMLHGRPCPAAPGNNSFYRLRSAGLIKGESPQQARPRCGIYTSFLLKHLA